ncbi:MAG: fatty acid--CoA ligase family protein [Actinobacteria bacterium]|nr:fatty acid--CoA ligase family protein [Actinomycetota bacterium]
MPETERPTEWPRGDLEWGTIPRLARSSAERFSSREAIVDVDAGVTLSFEQLAGAANDTARAFLARGLEQGDRVAIWAPNIWEWVVAALGVHSAGGVLVPLNTRFKGREAAYILGKARARALVTTTGFLDTDYVAMLRDAVDVPADLPDLETIVVMRGEAPAGTTGWDDFVEQGDVVSSEEAEVRADAVEPSFVSDILFTSGTTGNPKGVMCTHGQTLRAYRDWSGVVGLREGDRYLVVNPYFHAFGYKAGWLASLMMGATNLPHAVFDADDVLERVPRDRISMLPGPPTLYQSILNHPDRGRHDLSSLRLSVTGAAAIPVELILRMREELTFETIITGYGLTEACGIATMCRYDDDPETIATTSGRAIPGVEVQVVDDQGTEVTRGEPGEVVVRGYNVMLGYLDDPEETAATIDDDGWLHTGDVGVMDERGYLRITDRTKDMFIVGGFNAYPAEIENLMLRNEKVGQVAVVGVPDDRMGEVGMAFVVLRPDATATPKEIVEWCRGEMANFKAPRHVELVDELPLNATGKVLKYQLREQGTKIVTG